jgi:ABC-type sulfate transport system permease subunit
MQTMTAGTTIAQQGQRIRLGQQSCSNSSQLHHCCYPVHVLLVLLPLALQEVQALAAVGAHPNIVQYYSAWAEPDMQVGLRLTAVAAEAAVPLTLYFLV